MINISNTIEQYDFIKEYHKEKPHLTWNECCSLVGEYNQVGFFSLEDCNRAIKEKDKYITFYKFLKSILNKNKIESINIISK